MLTIFNECTEQDGTEADGNPTTVNYTEKVMLKQLGADSVSIETMTLYNSLKNKVGEQKKWRFHMINFG